MELAAVPSGATNLKPVVKVTEPTNAIPAHTLTATWEGSGSPGLQHRVALRVDVAATTGDWEWVVFGTETDGIPDSQPGITRGNTPGEADFGDWAMAGYNLSAAVTWPDDESTDTYTLSVEKMRAATHLRVDTRVDGGDWVPGTPVAISR